MVTAGIFPFKENSHGRAGNRTRDLMVSSQRLWPLDHEAGQTIRKYSSWFTILPVVFMSFGFLLLGNNNWYTEYTMHRCWGQCLDQREGKLQSGLKKLHNVEFIICTILQTLSDRSNQEGWNGFTCSPPLVNEPCTPSVWCYPESWTLLPKYAYLVNKWILVH